ncbi:MAG TPA: glycosyltransferase family 4 protein [Geminicoccaceae bacterium]|nr:glycosyltransferase family 4 protein [Geminicoccaceae bacterium]
MVRNGTSPVVVCFPFVGDQVGGSSISALNLIRHLDRQRYAPLILMHRSDGATARLFRDERLAFEPAPIDECASGTERVEDLRFTLRRAAPLARFLRRRGVGIVHTNDGRMHATWAIPARLAGARLLWHHRANPRASGLRFLAPWVADRVVSVSKFSSPRPGLLSAARKNTVVHSPFATDAEPVDRAKARRAVLDEFGSPPETHVVGFVGNLYARKRPLLFVEAIARMVAHDPDLAIAAPIYGETREGGAEVAAAIARHGLGDRVRLMGFRYPPEPWIAACDVLVVPAVEEPFGRSLIEAMLLGTPLIASDSGGNPEIIRHGETGYLVPADDPHAFAERTLALLADPTARAAIAAEARADAVGRFGMRRHAQSIMQIYDSILTH